MTSFKRCASFLFYCISSTLSISALAAETPSLASPLLNHQEFKALLKLQPSVTIDRALLSNDTIIELINLNADISQWYLLGVQRPGKNVQWIHLHSAGLPNSTHHPVLHLTPDGQLQWTTPKGQAALCSLSQESTLLSFLKNTAEPFTSLCSGSLYKLKTPSHSYKSSLETVTDWLRSQGSFGESLINLKKELLPHQGDTAQTISDKVTQSATDAPPAAALKKGSPLAISTANIGIPLDKKALTPGSWLPVKGSSSFWISITAPSYTPNPLQPNPSNSLVYSLALNLNEFQPSYAVGVDHPSLGWSTRAPLPHASSGPDGFSSLAPLARTGMIPPWDFPKIGAVITGGFKREHSAFKAGILSQRHQGSHYGFVQNGVVLSSLHPGLATFYQLKDGSPSMKIWTDQDNQSQSSLLFARQNGLPLIDNHQPSSKLSIDFEGNWSGNQDGQPLTMRSSLCLVEKNQRRYLIYSVFSNATPKDMAQTLQAYQCSFAMQLDMNAPSLTYAGIFLATANQSYPQFYPLLESMRESMNSGQSRFASTPDSRDFFYFKRS